ncbi:MAG TPA: alpha-2-macroglobulin family protein [Kofleriaceae bacterium]|nr:alpha-2-macroglobulin family protein [Kofleriaceae bacterium]
MAKPRALPAVAKVPAARPELAFGSDVDGKLTIDVTTASATAPSAAATPLTKGDTEALLARLEPLPAIDNARAPTMRPPSAKPAMSGTPIVLAFAAPTGRAVADRPIGPAAPQPDQAPPPLAPPQILPATGSIAMGSEIRVRFASSVIAVGEIGGARDLGAKLDPPIDGKWRWIDTRVVKFVPAKGRLPGSTKLTVTVAAGFRSVDGTVLATPVTAELTTPAIEIEDVIPRPAIRPDGAIAVQFTQAIDRDAIAGALHVHGKAGDVLFRVIDEAEARLLWAKQPLLITTHLHFDPATTLFLAPKTAWPAGGQLVVKLAAGAPSAEGPLRRARASLGQFSVAGKFELNGIRCDSKAVQRAAVCPAMSWATLVFSNEIDPKSFRPDLVQLVGLPFADHAQHANIVDLESLPDEIGAKLAVAIGDGLVDIYNQPYEGVHRTSLVTAKPRWGEWLSAENGLFVLDPRYQVPSWTVDGEALASMHVELYAVQARDYFAYEQLEEKKRATPPGKRVYAHDYTIGDHFAGEAHVDLRPALGAAGTGHVIAIATANGQDRQLAWIEVTKLGVVARVDGEQVNAWASDISPASFLSPRSGVESSILIEHGATTSAPIATDSQGHAAVALAELPPRKDANVVEPSDWFGATHTSAVLELATNGDSAFVPIDRDRKAIRTRSAEWYVADDRFTYKPGEPLYLKGWVRWTHDGVNPGIELPKPSSRVAYTVVDARGVDLATGSMALTAEGGFDTTVQLPATANLGRAAVRISIDDQEIDHPFQIEEFRTPAYAVELVDDVLGGGTMPLVLGEAVEMRADAHYYGGGGLGGATITWDGHLRAASYRPIGFDEFTFTPVRREPITQPDVHAEARLGTASSSTAVLGIAALPAGAPSLLEVDATVTDVDRQTIRATSHAIVVHPAADYVGLKVKEASVDTVEAVVVDLDNNAVAGVPIDVEFAGILPSERWRDDAIIRDTQHCHTTSAKTPVECSFTLVDKLIYKATARIADSRGRPNSARIDVPRWNEPAPHDALSLRANKKSYRAGETAKVTISSELVPSRAVVTYARQGVIGQHVVALDKPETVIDVPLDVSYLEDLHVLVDRFAKRAVMVEPQVSRDPLPQHDDASIDLAIDKRGSELAVTALPDKPVVGPGDQATFDVTVAKDGKPVAGAEVALFVVDEAILALSGAHHGDPLEPFYRSVDDGTSVASSFELVRDAGSDVAQAPGYIRTDLNFGTIGHGSSTGSGYGVGSGHGSLGGRSASAPALIKSRKDFRATAVWAPKLVTDANGRARVSVAMPDSLTRYRVVALVAKGAYYFGKAEGAIATRREVNARIVAPRFLTQGDAFELPIVVQNQGTEARTIDVVARAANLQLDGVAGKRVVIEAGQRAEVRFAFRTQARGTAAIETAIISGTHADSSTIELPVYEPATTESFATYGIVETAPVFERLDVPADIYRDVGGVEAELSSTQLQSLTDAYWYLQAYPYECAEQRSSRMLATAAMADVLDAFAVPNRASKADLAEQHAKDVDKLVADQLPDGSWGYWPGVPADPFVTMQVMQALAHDKPADAAVAKARKLVAGMLDKAFARLAARVDSRDRDATAFDVVLAATAMSALAVVGVDERGTARRLHGEATRLATYPIDAKARVLAIVAGQPGAKPLRAQLVRELLGATRETAAGASIGESYARSLAPSLPSIHRTTALVLDALIRETPQEPMIAKLARGLLGEQRGGRWRTTQENLVVMQAMRRYFDAYESATPNFAGKLWLGDIAYAEHAFTGHTMDRADAALGWSPLAPGSHHDLAFAKTGPGRMYYRIGITYAPAKSKLAALDAGFIVHRQYEAIDDPNDVVKTADGWTIRLGARVRIVIEASSTTPNDSVALVDPLPAGLEGVNTHLATAERGASGEYDPAWRYVEMRDERAEAFALALAPGAHRFAYTARATTPGVFVAAPAKAEAMYEPETFGRTASEAVTIR